ncbi:hypothetical protein PSHT_04758 [Puccinia striiformis]|uniref:DNA polymerase delta subunit 3 n=1 Tax=Puccinia striiformis TaxID=27350 RepID=A0A2S4WC41_9BASI|nr:hypothetical protein PSHT_04758 [Puccinia striiformis]
MHTVDPQLIQKWIKQRIIFDQATITFRQLIKEASCGADQARTWLEQFCDSEDGKRLKVEPSYLIFGTDTKSIQTLKIEIARAAQLQDCKAKFDSVSCVQIHSISPTQAPDPNLLKSYTEARIHLQSSKSSPESSKKESQDKSPKSVKSEPKKDIKKNGPSSQTTTTLRTKKNDDNDEKPDGASQSTLNSDTQGPRSISQNVHASLKVPSKRSVSEVVDPQNSSDKKTKTDPSTINSTLSTTDTIKGTERKRVTKTRIIQKKKIVRVKDLKGYRVNREEIHEVEEAFTDWESDHLDVSPEEEDLEKKMKKKKEAKTTSGGGLDQSTSQTVVHSGTTPLDLLQSEQSETLPLQQQPQQQPQQQQPHQQLKKKTPTSSKPTKKDQSNITSFFKKKT